ncbi:MAG TPA: endonuclease III [Candidatus Omnitrophota bacterium]|nr:endonuclease III [Candidatus Omnitrophota bacterium]
MDTSKRIRVILSRLNRAYGKPELFPRSDPVDEVVRTVLSQNTNDRNSLAAFAVLKKAFTPWSKALTAPVLRIARLIRHAGLSNLKAGRIKDILKDIKRREGRLSLSRVGKMSVSDGLEYLMSFKGVGPKTAACVMLFSFRKTVMPVDTHIFRVTKRLGLIGGKTGIEEAHRILDRLVPNNLKFNFHLGIIEHGRQTCKAQNPRCGSCVLYSICKFIDKMLYKCKVKSEKCKIKTKN